jgi:predicted nucleic acid-binding protein
LAIDKLLDNNVISILVSDKDPRRPNAEGHMRASSGCRFFLPVIAVAEIESGMAKVTNPAAEPQRRSVRAFLYRYPVLPFDRHTVEPYSLLRAKLWHLCGTPKGSGRGHIEKLPEELCDRVSGRELGIDERDLQIVSIALQHNLVFATFDRNSGMLTIERAAAALVAEGKITPLLLENWSVPLPAAPSSPAK